MKRGRRISRAGIAVCGCILLLYAALHMDVSVSLSDVKEYAAEPNRILLSYMRKTCFAGLAFAAEERHFSPREWLAAKAADLIPLGTYVAGNGASETDTEDRSTYEMILARQSADENEVDEDGKLVGEPAPQAGIAPESVDMSMEKLKNYEYLVGNFYTVDSTTMTGPEELDAEALLGKDMRIDTSGGGPKVLIYHTHSQEGFADSVAGDTSTTIVGMGEYLTELLNARGIETIHHEGVYDLIGGELDRSKAYQLAKPQVKKILEENPGIEVLIDLHRDGVKESTHLATEINGKPTAQIMFFNGLSRTKANGNIDYLYNPYIQDNLAFSLQMQLKAMELYPGFTRHIYLKGYCYNMNLMPKTLLIEAGAQTNTVEEMRNAMELLAEVLDNVLTP